MTWNELNERTGYMLNDAFPYNWEDLELNDMTDEPIWPCILLDEILDTLRQFDAPTNAWGQISDNHAEYLDNQMLIKELENVR